jgi:hypothetical protein
LAVASIVPNKVETKRTWSSMVGSSHLFLISKVHFKSEFSKVVKYHCRSLSHLHPHCLHHKNSMASQYLFGSLLPVTSFFLLVAYKYRISTEKSLSDAQCNSTSCCYSCNIPSFAAKIQVLSPRMFLYMVWLSPLCAFLSVHLYSPLFHLLSKLNRYSLINVILIKHECDTMFTQQMTGSTSTQWIIGKYRSKFISIESALAEDCCPIIRSLASPS